MSIEDIAAQALAERAARISAFNGVKDTQALEALRAAAVDEKDRAVLDLVILLRKREAKGVYEAEERLADGFDKAALPLAAAFPGFFTVLVSAGLLTDPWRTHLLLPTYLFAGAVWMALRWLSYTTASRARRKLAALGKVD